jgi:hypothetical protein
MERLVYVRRGLYFTSLSAQVTNNNKKKKRNMKERGRKHTVKETQQIESQLKKTLLLMLRKRPKDFSRIVHVPVARDPTKRQKNQI